MIQNHSSFTILSVLFLINRKTIPLIILKFHDTSPAHWVGEKASVEKVQRYILKEHGGFRRGTGENWVEGKREDSAGGRREKWGMVNENSGRIFVWAGECLSLVDDLDRPILR